MHILRSCLALAAAAVLVGACAQPKRGPPPSTEFEEEHFKDAVRMLASDEFAGRRPGTAGEDATVAYLVAQFRRLQLKPASGESFLQNVPMMEFAPEAAPTLTISGDGAARALVHGKDVVLWTRRAVPPVRLSASELVFVGYGIVAPEYGWNDYAGADVRGKTVVVLGGDPGQAAGAEPGVFRGATLTHYGHWRYKFEEAARHGAGGVLLIHDKDAVGIGWDAVLGRWGGPQVDRVAADAPAAAAVEGWLAAGAARALFARAGLEYGAAAAAAAHRGFKPAALGLRADAEIRASIRRFNSANVIAILPGRQHRDEYVVYTAHWDHLGRVVTPAGEQILHGAVDNAAGVAGLLMLARSFSRLPLPPERTIVFMATTGGDAGLAGSGFYVDNPIFPLENTVAAINLDQLHIGGPTRDVSVLGFGQSELDAYVRDAATLQGRELHVDPYPERGAYYGSDSFSFARRGVPALYFTAGIDDAARGPAWGRARLQDYYENRYCQVGDDYSPDWDVRGTLDDLRLYFRVGLRLAQSRRFPNWLKGSEFRSYRERSPDAD